jgi:hypothetical protein
MAVRLSAFTPQEDSWYSFLLEAADPRATVWLEEIGELRKSTSLGLELVTFQLVA